jgi:MinD-like ATPase involved in chromosome partitioning or flagellar assembly
MTPAPMTWLDVARALVTKPSSESARSISLLRARVGWFGVVVEASKAVDDAIVAKWLESIFPSRIKLDPLRIQLEGPQQATDLPVEIEVVGDELFYRPTFGVVDGIIDFAYPERPQVNERPVSIAAILSVKGGTGRTTVAVAFALRWAEKANKPVLLVDADLEAPGISYLFKATAGDVKISLEDIVALAHSESDPSAEETVAYAAERLRDHLVTGNIIIMPLRRDLGELASSAIRPEHLSTPDRPYAIADLLAKIAGRLGCDGVVVDVRAGLVPLGVNLAMDPSVCPIIVTTLSDQALKATSALVHFLTREMRRAGSELKKPMLVINRVPALFHATGMDNKLIEPLAEELLTYLVPDRKSDVSPTQGIFDESTDLEPFVQVELPELADIQVSAANWDGYLTQLRSSGLSTIAAHHFDQWIDSELGRSQTANQVSLVSKETAAQTNDRRALLANFSEKLISAETARDPVSKPLVTKPLAALTQRFQSEVPIAVSEGAKGTGKTLAARYFIAQKTWDVVVRELIGRDGATQALIVPVCASVQASSSYQEQVDSARLAIGSSLGLDEPQKISSTISWLKQRLSESHSEQEWVGLWLDLIAWCSGFKVEQAGVGEDFLQALRDTGRTAVALIEGFEELYTSVDDVGVRAAIRSALVSLPQKLRSESRRPLGLLIFARRDTVEAAITQNLDQYRREYGPFALTWTDDDVLELAAWLATQAAALPGLWTPSFGSLGQDEKAAKLEELWGRKLGPDDVPGRRIREAYTATWIIAVLSDLQGRLVPRDLIRLMSSAARVSITPEERASYSGRLLIPRALKNAVEPTSEQKVAETEEEIRELKPIFSKFKGLADKLAAPLSQEALDELGIGPQEVETLKRHGIVFGDTVPYEVPELFRRGLKLRHAGARRSVVNLYRRARQI